MSNELGISLALVTLASCWSCYVLGKWEEKTRWQNMRRREREREARWQEFDDQD
jgi:hypothetical protein